MTTTKVYQNSVFIDSKEKKIQPWSIRFQSSSDVCMGDKSSLTGCLKLQNYKKRNTTRQSITEIDADKTVSHAILLPGALV